MKKLFSVLFMVVLMAGVSCLNTACSSDDDSDIDYYGFSQAFKENQDCDFSALSPVYNKYKDWQGWCKNTSESQAQAKWSEAEAAFKAVESQLTAAPGCFIEIRMHRYHPVNGTFTPIQTIGTWRFPASN